jgi:3-vinyl bacteriochlorophyllide hydratase
MKSDPWNWTSHHFYRPAGGDNAFWPRRISLSRFLNSMIEDLIDGVAPCPWTDGAGPSRHPRTTTAPRRPLYTPSERQRRDASGWTLVQGILAPIQFAIFLVSLGLVLNYLITGNGFGAAAVSVVVKTMALYAIMITGAIWEKEVFGKYLFAASFFWEDVFSMLVIGLHTAYLAAMLADWSTPHARMMLALAAYATYAINATQFLLKLRAARLEAPRLEAPGQPVRSGM